VSAIALVNQAKHEAINAGRRPPCRSTCHFPLPLSSQVPISATSQLPAEPENDAHTNAPESAAIAEEAADSTVSCVG
jgi:hypothetical protein